MDGDKWSRSQVGKGEIDNFFINCIWQILTQMSRKHGNWMRREY